MWKNIALSRIVLPLLKGIAREKLIK